MKSFLVKKKNTLKEALKSINNNGNKCVVVVDEGNKLLGTLSDGDIRKAIIKKANINSSIEKYFNKKSYYIDKKNNKNRNYIENLFLKKHIDLIPEIDDQRIVKRIITWSTFFGKEKKFKTKKTPVIIMAGGQGKRLKPFTNILPLPFLTQTFAIDLFLLPVEYLLSLKSNLIFCFLILSVFETLIYFLQCFYY